RPRLSPRRRGGQRQPAPAAGDPPVRLRSPGHDRAGRRADRGRRIPSGRRVGDAPSSLRPGAARAEQRARRAPGAPAPPGAVGGPRGGLLRRRRARGPATAGRGAPSRSHPRPSHRRAPRLVAMTPGNRVASLRFWIGGAVVGLALLAFGLVRPENGSDPFFVLLALAGVGYLATVTLVANGLRPSGRT